MPRDGTKVPGAAAAVLLVGCALLYVPLGYLLRYALVDFLPRPTFALAAVPVAALGALAHEVAVRGRLYARLRATVRAGLAAPLAALAGTALPLAARLTLFPVPGVPAPLVIGHAFLVEYLISLGLTWLALGTGSPRPGAAALAGLWIARAALGVRFRGGMVPFLELGMAAGAASLVALALARPLAPHRDAVFGAS